MEQAPRRLALILGGGVVKGAFEAGALEVIGARKSIVVRRIVAASSGALNGTVFAAGVRARRESAAARDLVDAWEKDASLTGTLHPSLLGILGRRGISDQTKLLRLLRGRVKPSTIDDPAPVDLHLVVAPLCGARGSTGQDHATSYSRVLHFGGESFDDESGLERVFVAATASAALPVLFVPVVVPGVGPCSDGGLVNNTPILAVFGQDNGADLDGIIVVTPTPAVVETPSETHRGVALVAHQIDMVFAEWLYQDLRRAIRQNAALDRLRTIGKKHDLSRRVIEEIKGAFGLAGVRSIPILAIRPAVRLPGTLLSGFTHPAMRRAYIELGRARAAEVLDDAGWG
jgi:predicted acylesterase/phospholipase RssA